MCIPPFFEFERNFSIKNQRQISNVFGFWLFYRFSRFSKRIALGLTPAPLLNCSKWTFPWAYLAAINFIDIQPVEWMHQTNYLLVLLGFQSKPFPRFGIRWKLRRESSFEPKESITQTGHEKKIIRSDYINMCGSIFGNIYRPMPP